MAHASGSGGGRGGALFGNKDRVVRLERYIQAGIFGDLFHIMNGGAPLAAGARANELDLGRFGKGRGAARASDRLHEGETWAIVDGSIFYTT